jgi:signal transduction histidine kinase
MLLGITERNLEKPLDTLTTAHETLAKAIIELRTLSRSLDKEWLAQFRFLENITGEVLRVNASGILQVQLVADGDLPIDAEKQIMLFRVVQEAIQNAVKHAAATKLLITVERNDRVLIVIRDNGTGMNEGVQKGMGIMNMTRRVQLLNGMIEWLPAEPHGTEIIITLPLNNHYESNDRVGG